MANSNIIIKNYNGTTYDELYPKTVAEQIVENDTKQFVSNTEKSLWNSHNNYVHPTGTNPHNTTKSDLGLSNVDNTSDLNKPISTLQSNALSLKVDKVTGKQLSTNDFSNNYKTKLDEISKTTINKTQPTSSSVGDIWYQII